MRTLGPIVFLSLLALLMLYTGAKLSFLVDLKGIWVYVLTPMLFALMIGWQILYRVHKDIYNRSWFRAFAWVGSLVFGLWGAFMLISFPFDAVLASGLVALDPVALYRALFGVALIIACIGAVQAISGPRLKTVSLAVEKLAPSLESMKIVQISDLHVGAIIRASYVERVVAMVNSVKPDLVVVTGDLVDGTVETLGNEVAALAKLNAPLGVFFATGNHDYYSGVTPWLAKLQELGVMPLINENRLLAVGEAQLMVAGITDPSGGHFISEHRQDLEKASRGGEQSDFKLLLAHQPNICVEASRAGYHLQLSGHTHSGQFFPFSLLVRLAHRYYRGLNLHDKLWVYVNPGTGFWGPPLRFLVPSEVTLFELKGN